MAYNVSNDYKRIIYSQEDENDIKVWFNEEELENAGYYIESVTCTSRILPNDATKRFSLDNFISKEINMVLHNVDLDDIQDQVEISIGTLVGNEYEYVPLGVFNIQDTPTTNNGTITLKLRDNRVKFDFGYNAQYLMDQHDGKATLMEILEDICIKAGVPCNVEEFAGDDIETGYVDNSITATTYISYIAEQAGCIAVINREGELDFIDLNESTTWRIPLSIMSDNYKIESPYTIERVVYETALTKYQTSDDESLSTLYINSANPFVIQQEQVDYILENFENFCIDGINLSTPILGNPAIDPWDFIEVYDDSDIQEPTIFKTLANNDYTFNGKNRQLFVTEIGTEERKENVTIQGEPTYKHYVKTVIDNIEHQIVLQAAATEELSSDIDGIQSNLNENYYPKTTVEQMIVNAETGVTNTFSEAGGNNVLRNTNFSAREVLEQGQVYEYWFGNVVRDSNTSASNGISIKLQNDTLYQTQNISNGAYTLSFYYKVLNPLATVKVKINDKEYLLTEDDYELFQTGVNEIDPINITSNSITVSFISDMVNSCEIYDIMLNSGTIKLAYSQNANEVVTNTVNISKGITITASDKDVKFVATPEGIKTKTMQDVDITTFTYKGMTTKEAVIENQAEIVGILRQRVGDQVWDSLI